MSRMEPGGREGKAAYLCLVSRGGGSDNRISGAHYRGLGVYLNVRKRAHKHVFVSVWDVQYWLSGVPLASGCSASNVQGREAFDTT